MLYSNFSPFFCILILLFQSGNGSIDYLDRSAEIQTKLELQQVKKLFSTVTSHSSSCLFDNDVWSIPSKKLVLCNILIDTCAAEKDAVTALYCSKILKQNNPKIILCILTDPYSFFSEMHIPENTALYTDYLTTFRSEAKGIISSINFIIVKHFQNLTRKKLIDLTILLCKSSNLISSVENSVNTGAESENFSSFKIEMDAESHTLLADSWIREMSKVHERKLTFNKFLVNKFKNNYDVNIVNERQNMDSYSPLKLSIDNQNEPKDRSRKSSNRPSPSPSQSSAPSEFYYDDDSLIDSGSSNSTPSPSPSPSISITISLPTQTTNKYSNAPTAIPSPTDIDLSIISNSPSVPSTLQTTTIPTTPTSVTTYLPTVTMTTPPSSDKNDKLPTGIPTQVPSPVYQPSTTTITSSPTLYGVVGRDWWYLTECKCWLWGLHNVVGIISNPNSAYSHSIIDAVEYAFTFFITDDLSGSGSSSSSGSSSLSQHLLKQTNHFDSTESSTSSTTSSIREVVVLAKLCVAYTDVEENNRLSDSTYGQPISLTLSIWSTSNDSPYKIKLAMEGIAASPELIIGLLHEQGITDTRKLNVKYYNSSLTTDPPPAQVTASNLYDAVGNIAWVIGGTILLFVMVVCTVGGIRFYCGKLSKRFSRWLSNSSRYQSFQTNSDLDEFKLDDDEVTIELHNI